MRHTVTTANHIIFWGCCITYTYTYIYTMNHINISHIIISCACLLWIYHF